MMPWGPERKRAHAAPMDDPRWDVACPTCEAPPGYPCVSVSRWRWDERTGASVRGRSGATMYAFHSTRGR